MPEEVVQEEKQEAEEASILAEGKEKLEMTSESARKEEKKIPRKAVEGIAYIYTTFNNTVVTRIDWTGSTISREAGGMITKQDRLKATPTVSMFVAKKAAETAKEAGVTSLYVKIRAKTNAPGPGPGAHAAIKALSTEGMKIINIADVTKFPRGGPKIKGGKRGRRV